MHRPVDTNRRSSKKGGRRISRALKKNTVKLSKRPIDCMCVVGTGIPCDACKGAGYASINERPPTEVLPELEELVQTLLTTLPLLRFDSKVEREKRIRNSLAAAFSNVGKGVGTIRMLRNSLRNVRKAYNTNENQDVVA